MDHKDFAVFVDRDGTINVDVDFLSSPGQLQLIPRSADAIRELNELGIPVIVVTNQSGIARGLYSEADLAAVHAALDAMLKTAGASVQRYYYCPHHPSEGIAPYVTACRCRKPSPGMLLDAQREFGFDLTRSFMVGDKRIDMEAGRAAGTTTVQVGTGYGEREREAAAGLRDQYTADLYGAVQYIKSIVNQ
ncbi:MAG: HAD family hydrolase [Bacteroidetes bacterium]|nr:HAD family hydrolase [Bacteroidota bacterium]